MATGSFKYEDVTIQGSSRAHLGHNLSGLPVLILVRLREADQVYF
jgi:hypothetical protein